MNVGGQAVIEGVMMRAPRAMAVAVRRSNGEIVVRDEPWRPFWSSPVIRRMMTWPVFRGGLVLVESVVNGFQALSFAADTAELESGAPARPGTTLLSLVAQLTTSGDGRGVAPSRGGPPLTTFALSIAFGLSLFVGLPHALAWLVSWLTGGHWGVDSFVFHLLDGMFKLGIFVAYIYLISRIPEIERVFRYHGAEHKVVNAYERGRPLELDEVRLQGTFHARCGTSFVLFVLLVSVLVFAAVLPLIPPVSSNPLVNHLAMILVKIPLIVPLAGMAYEMNRWTARHPGAPLVTALVAPGRWMQRLTVREPDDDMLEISLAAMKVALHRENRGDDGLDDPVTIQSYTSLHEVEAAYPVP